MSYRYDMIDLIAALIGSLIVGGFLGLVPLICGLVKKRIGLAIGGFFACLGGGLLLGLILAVPMCVPVSYTHLDVYKRQPWYSLFMVKTF